MYFMIPTEEEWLPVPGYPGYEVSNEGRVRSLDRVVPMLRGGGEHSKKLKGKLLAQSKVGGSGSAGRYWGTTLFRDGKRKPVTVHVVMLEAFVGPRPGKAMGCHRDDDPDNNTIGNLYWGTGGQNVGDAIASGRHTSVAEAKKIQCPRGHDYTPENTYIKPKAGHRNCRTCHRREARESYARHGKRSDH